jgi:hypothetical protein
MSHGGWRVGVAVSGGSGVSSHGVGVLRGGGTSVFGGSLGGVGVKGVAGGVAVGRIDFSTKGR